MRPMFNRRAISSTDMRLLVKSANPSALDCVLPAIALPDVIHVNPRRAWPGGQMLSFTNQAVSSLSRFAGSFPINSRPIR